MFFVIEFGCSKVPVRERRGYLRRLDSAARAYKYPPRGKAYVSKRNAEYSIVVCDEDEESKWGCCPSAELTTILRELQERGCKIFSL